MKPVSLHEAKEWDGEISCLQKDMHHYNATDCIYRSEDTDTAKALIFKLFCDFDPKKECVCPQN